MENIAHPRRFLVLLMALASIGPMALNMPIPALPTMQSHFGVNGDMIQLTLSVYLLGMGASQIIMGPLSDRYGRRPIVLIGLLLGVICSIAAIFADTIALLITARFLQAVGATAGVVLARAMIRDLYPQDKAAGMIGYVTMGMMVTPMITPAIGGFLTEYYHWRGLFVFIALITLIFGVYAYFKLPETRDFKNNTRGFYGLFEDALELVKTKQFWGYCMVGTFSSATFFVFTGGGPYVIIEQMKRSPTEYGVWIALIALGYAFGNFISGRMTEKLGIGKMINYGSAVGIFSTLISIFIYLMGWLTTPLMLIFPQALLAMANGLQLPSSMAGALSIKPKITGSAAGVNGFIQMSIGAIVSQASGWLVATYQSAVPMLIILFASMCLAALFYHFMAKNND